MFSFFKVKNKKVVNKAPEKSHDEMCADYYRSLNANTREELREKMLRGGGCPAEFAVWQQAMFCNLSEEGGPKNCEDCVFFKDQFDYVCKCLSL